MTVDAFFWPSLTFALISSKDETMVIRTFSQVEETKTKQRVGLESVLSEYLLSPFPSSFDRQIGIILIGQDWHHPAPSPSHSQHYLTL